MKIQPLLSRWLLLATTLVFVECVKSSPAPVQRTDARATSEDVAHAPPVTGTVHSTTGVVGAGSTLSDAGATPIIYPNINGTWLTEFRYNGRLTIIRVNFHQGTANAANEVGLLRHPACTGRPGRCVTGTTVNAEDPSETGTFLPSVFDDEVGRVLTGSYLLGPLNLGRASMIRFEFTPDGQRFTGTWTQSPLGPNNGTWDAHRAPTVEPCTYPSHSVFHLRSTPMGSTVGSELITTRPRMEVLRSTTIRRGREAMYYVHFLDGTDRWGWMFIPVFELEGCARRATPLIVPF